MSGRNRVSKEKKKREGKDRQANAPNEPRTHVCSFGIMRETRQDMLKVVSKPNQKKKYYENKKRTATL